MAAAAVVAVEVCQGDSKETGVENEENLTQDKSLLRARVDINKSLAGGRGG